MCNLFGLSKSSSNIRMCYISNTWLLATRRSDHRSLSLSRFLPSGSLMSVTCGMECVVVLGCLRWIWKRITYIGSYDSATWPSAAPHDFSPVPRMCRAILAVYEEDLSRPTHPPCGGYRMDPDWVVKRVDYERTRGNAPPYLIYADHRHRQIVVAIRGLNLAKDTDYKLLLDNRLGMQRFDGGYVHHGLLKSAIWLLNEESETLRNLWVENGSSYEMVFAGHSLGSGVAALLAVIVANHGDRLGGVPRSSVRCYSMAPARCMSLNLAVKYADVIYSVILQDDFLPRTATPLEDIFRSVFCLPCLMFAVCLRDTFIPQHGKHRDPRRLYAPGRMYHIVERKFCRKTFKYALPFFGATRGILLLSGNFLKIRCGRFPPEVRTAIPVDGRFEHIVLFCNATADHAIIWIERESEKALENMKDYHAKSSTNAPKIQKIERQQTLEKEHKVAMERAVSLKIPHAEYPSDEDPSTSNKGEFESEDIESHKNKSKEPKPVSSGSRTNWDIVVQKLLKKDRELLLKKDTPTIDL